MSPQKPSCGAGRPAGALCFLFVGNGHPSLKRWRSRGRTRRAGFVGGLEGFGVAGCGEGDPDCWGGTCCIRFLSKRGDAETCLALASRWRKGGASGGPWVSEGGLRGGAWRSGCRPHEALEQRCRRRRALSVARAGQGAPDRGGRGGEEPLRHGSAEMSPEQAGVLEGLAQRRHWAVMQAPWCVLLPTGHRGCLSLWLRPHPEPHGQPGSPGSYAGPGVARGSANSCGGSRGGWPHHCVPG